MARAFLTALLSVAGAAATAVSEHAAATHLAHLDLEGTRQLLSKHEKVYLLMHVGECARTKEFLPTLAEIARQTTATIAVLDVKRDPSSVWVAAFKSGLPSHLASGIMPDRPVFKAYFRDSSPNHVQLYRGPPSLEATLDWVGAIEAWAGPFDDFAWLDAAAVPQQSKPPSTPGGGPGPGGATPRQEGGPRWAGKEGAFNGPTFDDAYRHVMGDQPSRVNKDEV